MERHNIRYGVVNTVNRAIYEKQFHVPMGYDFIGYNKGEAIQKCREKTDPNWVVEMIYDTTQAVNNKMTIFRRGNDEENN